MKLLLDTCVWGGALKELADAGINVIWTGNWDEDPGDGAILKFAHQTKRVPVTLDKDFGELAILRGQKHAGIIRLVSIPARLQAKTIIHLMTQFDEDLKKCAIVTAQTRRVRIRS